MKKIAIYTMMMAAAMLTACKTEEPKNEAQGVTVELSFPLVDEMGESVDTDVDDNDNGNDNDNADMPKKAPGDPGTVTNDWVKPRYLYILVSAKSGDTNYMAAKKVTAAEWTKQDGNERYDNVISEGSKTTQKYDVTLPGVSLTNNTYYVYAIASPYELTFSRSINWASTGTAADLTLKTANALSQEQIEDLTYTIPNVAGKTRSQILRSIFSTRATTAARPMNAFQPTCELYHTASLLDLNWSNDAGFTSATLVLGNFAKSGLYCFKPGFTGSDTYTETITLTEATKYYGRYSTYVAQVSSLTVNYNSTSKTAAVNTGADAGKNTWQRVLWTVE